MFLLLPITYYVILTCDKILQLKYMNLLLSKFYFYFLQRKKNKTKKPLWAEWKVICREMCCLCCFIVQSGMKKVWLMKLVSCLIEVVRRQSDCRVFGWRECRNYVEKPVCGPLLPIQLVFLSAAEQSQVLTNKEVKWKRVLRTMNSATAACMCCS